MFLKKVLIQNYRLFRTAEFEFNNSDGKNISLIFGDRGIGKYTFFNAIGLCLYGKELSMYSDFPPSSMGICNKKAVNLTSIGEEIEVKVELVFLNDGETFKINRSIGYIKMEDGLRRQSSLDKFEIKTSESSDLRFTNEPHYFIEKYFPIEFSYYFLVDSEKFIHDFKKYQSNIFKESFLRVTQINLIGNMRKNISRVQKRYIALQNKLNPQIGEINHRIMESKNKLEQNQEQINRIVDEINHIDKVLSNYDLHDFEKILRINRELDKKIHEINNQLKELENQLKKHVLLNYPYVMSYNSFKKFLELVPFYLEDSDDNSIEDKNLNSTIRGINEIITDTKKFKSTAITIHKDFKALKKERETCICKKRDLESNILIRDSGRIKDLIFMRENLTNHKESLENKILDLKHTLKINEESLLREKESSSQQEIAEYQKRIDFCSEISESIDLLYNDLTETLRKQLQEFIKKNFLDIHGNEGYFVDVIIDSDFNIFLKNRFDYIVNFDDLSYGERICLGMCFILALHDLSGIDLPIILIGSFFILDQHDKNSYLALLSRISQNNQLIILENLITSSHINEIDDRISKKYIVYYNIDDGEEIEVVLDK